MSQYTDCALKRLNDRAQHAVYDALFKKGLEGSMISNRCPLAAAGNWEDCPFYNYPI